MLHKHVAVPKRFERGLNFGFLVRRELIRLEREQIAGHSVIHHLREDWLATPGINHFVYFVIAAGGGDGGVLVEVLHGLAGEAHQHCADGNIAFPAAPFGRNGEVFHRHHVTNPVFLEPFEIEFGIIFFEVAVIAGGEGINREESVKVRRDRFAVYGDARD